MEPVDLVLWMVANVSMYQALTGMFGYSGISSLLEGGTRWADERGCWWGHKLIT